MMIIEGLIIALYISLIVELTCFHVPSVANTQVFFCADEKTVNSYDRYRKIFYWSKSKKVVLLLIPHLVNMTVFVLPLVYVAFGKTSSGILSSAGTLIALLGRGITFFSMLYVRKNNSQVGSDFTLHETGPFSRMRNPGLTGMLLFFTGLTMVWPTILMVFALIYYFFYNHFRILIEEDYLRVKYGDKYIQYLGRVSRYF